MSFWLCFDWGAKDRHETGDRAVPAPFNPIRVCLHCGALSLHPAHCWDHRAALGPSLSCQISICAVCGWMEHEWIDAALHRRHDGGASP
jgi:hypothetical protein